MSLRSGGRGLRPLPGRSLGDLPIVAVGSFLISTDTIMAPFLAGALLLYWRLCAGGTARDAILGGLLAPDAADALLLCLLLFPADDDDDEAEEAADAAALCCTAIRRTRINNCLSPPPVFTSS